MEADFWNGDQLMSAMDEVNHWRRHNRLPEFIEDPELTEFAQMKAEYRALRGLKNGHQGPKWPPGTTEGTGEATADWGWLTCAMEDSSTHAGAGMCIGWDGERYMVLVVRPPGRRLIRQVHPIDTSHLTPDPVHVRDLGHNDYESALISLVEAKRKGDRSMWSEETEGMANEIISRLPIDDYHKGLIETITVIIGIIEVLAPLLEKCTKEDKSFGEGALRLASEMDDPEDKSFINALRRIRLRMTLRSELGRNTYRMFGGRQLADAIVSTAAASTAQRLQAIHGECDCCETVDNQDAC